MTSIQLSGELLVDGLPVACSACNTTRNLTATVSRIPIASWPAWVNCPDGHGEEHPAVTNAMIGAILAARTGRTRATDRDTFDTEVDGHQVVGELHPQLCVDDLRETARAVYRLRLRPGLRRTRRQIGRAASRNAKGLVSAPYAAAIGAVWNARTGIADPTRIPPARRCPSCKGKGELALNSRIHDSATVPCGLCAGTGDADAI